MPVPRQIPHGKVDILPYNRFGAVARYTCQDGYTLVGLPARVCQGDETWNGDEPRCELNHRLLGEKTPSSGYWTLLGLSSTEMSPEMVSAGSKS